MTDILLLLARRDTVSTEDFEKGIRATAAGLAGHQLAFLMPADALPALAHVAKPDPSLPDSILTLTDAPEASLLSRLAPMIDPQRSKLFAATRHAVLPGKDAIRLVFGLRRLERLSLAEFHDYWLNHHAEIGRRLIPPYTYHQLHAEPAKGTALAAAAGLTPSDLDGMVEVHFPDIDAFVRQLSRPEVAEEALADERNFIDHARSIFWAYSTAS